MFDDGDASAAQRGEVLGVGGEDRDRPGAANAVAAWRAISSVIGSTRQGSGHSRVGRLMRCGPLRRGWPLRCSGRGHRGGQGEPGGDRKVTQDSLG